jgi:hypothetical protein
VANSIAELPFTEREIHALLNLDATRDEPDLDYAGYGWARVSRIWLVDERKRERAIDDALVLALHTADDTPEIEDDLELELDLPGGEAVAVRASKFLSVWLPVLPRDVGAIVFCVCNPHAARLALPAEASAPLLLPTGDVTSWIDRDTGAIKLMAEAWDKLTR